MSLRNYSTSAVAARLTGRLLATDVQATVDQVTGWPQPPFTLILDRDAASEEVATCTDITGLSIRLARGEDGTSALTHEIGGTVEHGISGRDLREPNVHVNTTGGVPSKALSLNGTLGLALGARGKGKAAAHFEPSNLVINLTKTQGAGSLAHEWFHALDNYFARERGGEVPFGGSSAEYRSNNFITYKPEPMLRSLKGFGLMTRAEVERRHALHPDAPSYDLRNWVEDEKHKQGVRPVVEKEFANLVNVLNASPTWRWGCHRSLRRSSPASIP